MSRIELWLETVGVETAVQVKKLQPDSYVLKNAIVFDDLGTKEENDLVVNDLSVFSNGDLIFFPVPRPERGTIEVAVTPENASRLEEVMNRRLKEVLFDFELAQPEPDPKNVLTYQEALL